MKREPKTHKKAGIRARCVRMFATAIASTLISTGAWSDEVERTLPVPIEAPMSAYPAALLTAFEGKQVVSYVIVTKDGNVLTATVADSPDDRFNSPTLNALRRWRFEPALGDGKPIGSSCVVRLRIAAEGAVPEPVERLPMFESPPQVVTRAPLVGPIETLRPGESADVIVRFFVDREGRATDAVVAESSHKTFNGAAIKSVLQWKFVPATSGGNPVVSAMAQRLLFTRSEEITPAMRREKSVLPKLKEALRPVHPFDHAVSGKSGSASVLVVIDRDGRVRRTSIDKSSEEEFGFACAAAFEVALFEPGSTGGRPERTTMTQRHTFKIGSKDSSIDKTTVELTRRIRSGKFSPFDESDLDTPLTATTTVSAVYPTSLLDRAVVGSAKIEVIVDKDGRAVLPRIVEASEPEFGWAAATAVQRWRFAEPTMNGKPVEVRTTIPFNFTPDDAADDGSNPDLPLTILKGLKESRR